ncbi:hypothetical protein DJ90_1510 [Paenibacillus macerans]|uniref:Uncharacterized protein n=1 Tax=Paenibacillus macerans TaxID=44252 RepID=A0A090ZDJ1_PAEMA|nr:hypothetical protein DJ90_1510 [Paenibacillus macerans]
MSCLGRVAKDEIRLSAVIAFSKMPAGRKAGFVTRKKNYARSTNVYPYKGIKERIPGTRAGEGAFAKGFAVCQGSGVFPDNPVRQRGKRACQGAESPGRFQRRGICGQLPTGFNVRYGYPAKKGIDPRVLVRNEGFVVTNFVKTGSAPPSSPPSLPRSARIRPEPPIPPDASKS